MVDKKKDQRKRNRSFSPIIVIFSIRVIQLDALPMLLRRSLLKAGEAAAKSENAKMSKRRKKGESEKKSEPDFPGARGIK